MKKIIIVFFVVIMMGSCTAKSDGSGTLVYEAGRDYSGLPVGADNVKEYGNGWLMFDFQGHTFLYRHVKSVDRGYEALTMIK